MDNIDYTNLDTDNYNDDENAGVIVLGAGVCAFVCLSIAYLTYQALFIYSPAACLIGWMLWRRPDGKREVSVAEVVPVIIYPVTIIFFTIGVLVKN